MPGYQGFSLSWGGSRYFVFAVRSYHPFNLPLKGIWLTVNSQFQPVQMYEAVPIIPDEVWIMRVWDIVSLPEEYPSLAAYSDTFWVTGYVLSRKGSSWCVFGTLTHDSPIYMGTFQVGNFPHAKCRKALLAPNSSYSQAPAGIVGKAYTPTGETRGFWLPFFSAVAGIPGYAYAVYDSFRPDIQTDLWTGQWLFPDTSYLLLGGVLKNQGTYRPLLVLMDVQGQIRQAWITPEFQGGWIDLLQINDTLFAILGEIVDRNGHPAMVGVVSLRQQGNQWTLHPLWFREIAPLPCQNFASSPVRRILWEPVQQNLLVLQAPLDPCKQGLFQRYVGHVYRFTLSGQLVDDFGYRYGPLHPYYKGGSFLDGVVPDGSNTLLVLSGIFRGPGAPGLLFYAERIYGMLQIQPQNECCPFHGKGRSNLGSVSFIQRTLHSLPLPVQVFREFTWRNLSFSSKICVFRPHLPQISFPEEF